ncbi:hypothetical protein ACLOJK_036223 [Asimina triloba]
MEEALITFCRVPTREPHCQALPAIVLRVTLKRMHPSRRTLSATFSLSRDITMSQFSLSKNRPLIYGRKKVDVHVIGGCRGEEYEQNSGFRLRNPNASPAQKGTPMTWNESGGAPRRAMAFQFPPPILLQAVISRALQPTSRKRPQLQ